MLRGMESTRLERAAALMPVAAAARRRGVRVEKCMVVVEMGGRSEIEDCCFVWKVGRGMLVWIRFEMGEWLGLYTSRGVGERLGW